MSSSIQKSMAVTAFASPLTLLTNPLPQPTGAQVLIKTKLCGLCHSDLHQIDGYFSLGGDDKLDLAAARALPYCVGHEIVGEVIAVGDDARNRVQIGHEYAIYPWGGCRECGECKAGAQNLCTSRKDKLDIGNGNNMRGGYSSHVLVPHYEYCFDTTGLDPAMAATCMCAGLTAYSAVKKAGKAPNGAKDILILGLGGVGMQGLEMVKAMYGEMPLAADIRPEALEAAGKKGARVFNAGEKGVVKQIRKASAEGSGIFAVLDFVGTSQTNAIGLSVIRKGGSVIQIGLLGGKMTIPLPVMTFKGIAVKGTITGTLQECEEMFELLREGKVGEIPMSYRSIADVNQSLEEMRQGKLVGRVVLKHDWEESQL